MNAAHSPASTPTQIRWRIVAMLSGLCFVSHLNRLAITVAGTERIIPGYDLTPTAMGTVYTAYLSVYTAAMLLGGWCIDRFGPKVMLAVMGLGSALFGALSGGLGWVSLTGAQLIVGLMVVRGAMGLFTAPLHPACARAVASWMPVHQIGWGNGLVTFAAVLGMASTYWVVGTLLDHWDWPVALMTVATALLAVTLLWWWGGADHPGRHPAVHPEERHFIGQRLPEADPAARRMARGSFLLLLDRNLILLTLSYAAVGYFQYLFFYWAEFYFKDVIHLSVGESRNATTVLILALGVGMPLGGYLAGRAQRALAGRRGWIVVPATGMTFSAVFLFLGVMPSSPAWIVIWFSLAMASLGVSESSFWQASVRLGGHRGATAAAVINTGGNGIGLLAPLLTPWISAHLGWRTGLCLGGVVSLLGALCWLGIHPSRRA